MDREQKILITELTHGKDLAKKLRNHLNPSSNPETSLYLIQKIICSYEKALSMLNYDASLKSNYKLDFSIVESPCSFPNTTTPRSHVSDQDVYKKRKTMPQWTEQVKIYSGTGFEGTLDDGYCWRKYGQKDILGANFPRGYYRCTHRDAQHCLATKQVQRSDSDPEVFEVTYRGKHTCSQNSHNLPLASTSSRKQVSIDQKENEEKPKQATELMLSFGTERKVETEDLDGAGESTFPSFSFPYGHENVEGNLFLDSMMENNFMGTTSESNYLSMSPLCHMNLTLD